MKTQREMPCPKIEPKLLVIEWNLHWRAEQTHEVHANSDSSFKNTHGYLSGVRVGVFIFSLFTIRMQTKCKIKHLNHAK